MGKRVAETRLTRGERERFCSCSDRRPSEVKITRARRMVHTVCRKPILRR